jgi:fructose-1,6-bisphosphatase/inositol monophosphatase family enzyme
MHAALGDDSHDPFDGDETLSDALAQVGRAVRDAVRSGRRSSDAEVVRTEGGDDVYGVDDRADRVLVEELRRRCARRWPGSLVLEGYDEPVSIGDGGDWRYLADPVDGTRGLLHGLRSAWVLLGAGRDASGIEHLSVGAAVEIPTARAGWGRVAVAEHGRVRAVDDDLRAPNAPIPVALQPRADAELDRSFVTVVRLLPGGHGTIGAWADQVLRGWEVYDDLYPCTGGQLMAVADGSAAAVLDPRPLLHPGGFASHPYDLAAVAVAQAAGVVVEALPHGPLSAPLDTSTPVAWAAYANEAVAELLRPQVRAAFDQL